MTEPYPTPKSTRQRPQHIRLASSTSAPLNEFGATVEEYEERIFRTASHFNCVKFGSHNGSQIATVATFPQALALAHGDKRVLIYCVNAEGRAFCMSWKDYPKYAQVWLGMRKGAVSCCTERKE